MKISDHSVARACVAQRLRGQASNNSPIERITKTPITTIWLRKKRETLSTTCASPCCAVAHVVPYRGLKLFQEIRVEIQPSADCSAARTTSGVSVGTKLSMKA